MEISGLSMEISGLSTEISGLSMSAVRLRSFGRISNPTSAFLICPSPSPRKNPRFHRDFSAVNLYIMRKKETSNTYNTYDT